MDGYSTTLPVLVDRPNAEFIWPYNIPVKEHTPILYERKRSKTDSVYLALGMYEQSYMNTG